MSGLLPQEVAWLLPNDWNSPAASWLGLRVVGKPGEVIHDLGIEEGAFTFTNLPDAFDRHPQQILLGRRDKRKNHSSCRHAPFLAELDGKTAHLDAKGTPCEDLEPAIRLLLGVDDEQDAFHVF